VLIAEIRRKLLDVEDIAESAGDPIAQVRALVSSCKEDLLTADVFGAIKYLPRRPYLLAMLQAIAERNSNAKWFREHVSKSADFAEMCTFGFWPSYRTPPGIPGHVTEPDVELSAPETLIFVEAKLFSGFGTLQIERQLLIGLERAKDREFFLVLVTAGIRPPRLRLSGKRIPVLDYLRGIAATDALPKEYRRVVYENADRVLWVSWQAIFASLENAHRQLCDDTDETNDHLRCSADLLADLRTLLEMRQLQPFAGIVKRSEAISTSRPVFFAGEPVTRRSFRGVSAASLPGLLTVAALPPPVFPHGALRVPRSKECRIASIVAGYSPQALPKRWFATRHTQRNRQLIAGVVAQYQPRELEGHGLSHPGFSRTRASRPSTHAPNLIRSAVESYEPQALPVAWLFPTSNFPGARTHRAPNLRRIVSGNSLPGPVRLFRKGTQT